MEKRWSSNTLGYGSSNSSSSSMSRSSSWGATAYYCTRRRSLFIAVFFLGLFLLMLTARNSPPPLSTKSGSEVGGVLNGGHVSGANAAAAAATTTAGDTERALLLLVQQRQQRGSSSGKRWKSRVLVTGGAGYIGSHASLLLLELGYHVTVVDNLSRGNIGALRALEKEAKVGQFAFVRLDLGDGPGVMRLFAAGNFDTVLHFAAISYVGESVDRPLLYYHNVTVNTVQLLEAMESHGVQRLVYSSTCATYGDAAKMPITENTPQQPVSPYGKSKLMSETAIHDLARRRPEMRIGILRYFNVIGADPRGRVGEVPRRALARYGRISAACFKAARSHAELRSLSIFGTDHQTPDGTCIRDYVHVSDLVAAHVRVLSVLGQGAQQVQTYNVGVGRGYSVREFVAACKAITKVNITVIERPKRLGDAAAVYADPAKIKRETGWTPKFTDLHAALKTAWDWECSYDHTRYSSESLDIISPLIE